MPLAPADGTRSLEVGGHRFLVEQLSNGLTAIAVTDPEAPEGRASVFVVYAVGRRMETDATSGLAHLTEHTLFTGTRDTPAGAHDEQIRALGGEPNAYTRDDYTLYYDHGVPTDELATVLAMEADRMRGLVFDEQAFEAERDALEREETHTRSGARRREEQLEAVAFRVHAYRFGMPDEAGLSRGPGLSIETVRAFYDLWYHPQRCAVVVSGDVQPVVALRAIRTAFESMPRGTDSNATIPVEPLPVKARSFELASSLPDDVTHLGWIGPARFEAETGAHDRIALQVFAAALEEQLVGSEPQVHVSAGARLDRDLFLLSASGAHASTELDRLWRRIIDPASTPEALLSQESFDRAIERARSGPARTPLSSGRPYFSLAGRMAMHAALGQPEHLVERDRVLAELDRTTVLEVARRWLTAEGRLAVRFLASGEEPGPLPDDPVALAEVARDAAAADDLERAIAAYEKLLALGPNRMNEVIYRYSLGDLRMAEGDLEGARRDLERALEVVDYPAVRELLEEVERRMSGVALHRSGETPRD